jgi:hypothetical protein
MNKRLLKVPISDCLLLRHVRILAKSAYNFRHVRPSIPPSVRLSVCPQVTAQAPLKQSSLSFMSETVNKSRNLVTIGQQYRSFDTKPRKLRTGNCHQSAVFECNGIGLLGQSRRYKHYANAPRFYVTGTLLVFL